jgi:DNA segregation ATPase FtsK/SpoIIIE, S-DNA-T family
MAESLPGVPLSLDGFTSGTYQLPPAALLRPGTVSRGRTAAADAVTGALSGVFAQFKVNARVTGFRRGSAVTRYEVELGPGVQVEQVTMLHRNLSHAAKSAGVRIVSPVPGKSAIGIDVPNMQKEIVSLGDVLRSDSAMADHHPMVAGLGQDAEGNALFVNLAKLTHLLIAGATGSGKSACLHGLIISLLMRAAPAEVRMILIDPGRVELPVYNGIPHLITPVVTSPDKAAAALDWAAGEIGRRYDDLAANGFRHVDDFNRAIQAGRFTRLPGSSRTYEPYPYLLVIIDGLGGLMTGRARKTETSIASIARRGRQTRVHLVIATREPSTYILHRPLNSYLTSRLAFAASSRFDSQTALGHPGAETLAGPGEALFIPMGANEPVWLQNAFVSDKEIRDIVEHTKAQLALHSKKAARLIYRQDPASAPGPARQADAGTRDDPELLIAAAQLVISSQFGSTSMLQRKLRVGFASAGRLMDLLEARGIVGPSEGSKARDVLIRSAAMDEVLSSLNTQLIADA